MEKRVTFNERWLPYVLVAPQIFITLVFFFWPSGQMIWQSVLLEDAFGGNTRFAWFDNFIGLFHDGAYFASARLTVVFSFLVATLGLGVSLLLAVMADKPLRGLTFYRTLLIWPYAVAPAIAGVLWYFMFQPSLGFYARILREWGVDWNPLLNGDHALILIVLAATWKQISYNFLFFSNFKIF